MSQQILLDTTCPRYHGGCWFACRAVRRFNQAKWEAEYVILPDTGSSTDTVVLNVEESDWKKVEDCEVLTAVMAWMIAAATARGVIDGRPARSG